MWAMLPSFDQRTVSPTAIDRTFGLKKPTHGCGSPSHKSTSPTETKWVLEARVVLVVVEIVVVELVVVVVVVLELVVGEVVLGEMVVELAVVVGALEEVVGANTSDVVGAVGLMVVEADPARLVVPVSAVDVGTVGAVVAGESDESDAHAAASNANPITRHQVRGPNWLIRGFPSLKRHRSTVRTTPSKGSPSRADGTICATRS